MSPNLRLLHMYSCHDRRATNGFVLCLAVLMAAACTMPARPVDRGVLTALELTVNRIRQQDTHVLDRNNSIEVMADDKIELNEHGRALVEFYDGLNVELFRNTKVDVREVRPEPGGFVLTRLTQVAGHTRVTLGANLGSRIVLETSYAVIRPTTAETEFAVCHAEGILTCVVALQGEIQVEGEGTVVTVKGGEASYIFPEQAPVMPICANMNAVRSWLDALRSDQDVGDLGSLVASWPQQPCSQSAVSTPVNAPPEDSSLDSVLPEQATPIASDIPVPDGMVEIASGQYAIGSATPDEFHLPVQVVNLPAYAIDIFEVTNAQYAAYVNETGAPRPLTWSTDAVPVGQEQHPVRGLTWDDAAAYCAWAGKRLPTEAEWEAAARGAGSDPMPYPWGHDPFADGQANQLSPVSTYPVGSFAFNRSQAGVFDTIGNVWEWVSNPYAPTPDNMQVLHGGRFGLLRDIAYRQLSAPDNSRFVEFAGVRCAVDR